MGDEQKKEKIVAHTIHTYNWVVDKENTEETIIRAYGLNKQKKTVCLTITGFTPYIYLELPTNIVWDEKSALHLSKKLTEISSSFPQCTPLITRLINKYRLYYANTDGEKRKKFPYFLCAFKCMRDVYSFSKKLSSYISVPPIGNIKVKVHESNATPILQFTAQRKISMAGWLSFQGKAVEDKETHCDYEYKASWKKVYPEDDGTIARPLLMGYDIEVNSSRISAMPDAVLSDDKIFQISCVFARNGETEEKWEKYLLSLGDPDQKIVGSKVKIKRYDCESDIIEGFTDLILEKQPNICIGHNIFGFDIPYMTKRAQKLLVNKFFAQGFVKGKMGEIRNISWNSSAYKNQNFIFLEVEGRIFVDLLPLVKRDYKLPNYKLKTLAQILLKNSQKGDLTAQDIFRCYKIGMAGGKNGKIALGKVGKYCVQDSYIVVKLFEELKYWITLVEMSKITKVDIFDLFTRGQQLKMYSQVYHVATHENMVVERNVYKAGENDHYMGAIVFHPIPDLYQMCVSFDFNSLYPTTIIAYNISWDTLVLDETIPDSLCHVMEWEDHTGCEHDPKIIRKKELTELLAEKKQKLKGMREKRDADSKSNRERHMKKIKEFMETMKPISKERNELQKSKPKHILCSKRRFRWLKSPLGMLPTILSNLLTSRNATKDQMKKLKLQLENEKDEKKKGELENLLVVLDKRQLSMKICANSGYGCLGTRQGYLPFMPGAMCTTYKGRLAVQKAADLIVNKYRGLLIYGDTDSTYVTFPELKTVQDYWNYSVKISKEISKTFPRPMNLEYEEKVMMPFLIFSKKRYVYKYCKQDGIIKDELSQKGILLERRDNSNFIKKLYKDLIKGIFAKKSEEEVTDLLLSYIMRLLSASMPSEDFIITKEVGSCGNLMEMENEGDSMKYLVPVVDEKGKVKEGKFLLGDYKISLWKNQTEMEKKLKTKKADTLYEYCLRSLPPQVQLAEKMRKRGVPVSSGTRLEYILTTNGGHNAKQYIKIESFDYYKKFPEIIRIDYLDYLRQIISPIDQLFSVIYKKTIVQNIYKQAVLKEETLSKIKELSKPKVIFK